MGFPVIHEEQFDILAVDLDVAGKVTGEFARESSWSYELNVFWT